jgi:hypothetical protein
VGAVLRARCRLDGVRGGVPSPNDPNSNVPSRPAFPRRRSVCSSDARSVAGAILRGWLSRLVRDAPNPPGDSSARVLQPLKRLPRRSAIRPPADRYPRGRGDPSPRSRRQRPAGRTTRYVEGRLTTHAPALDIARSQPLTPTSCERPLSGGHGLCPVVRGITPSPRTTRAGLPALRGPGREGTGRPCACASPAGREPQHAVGGQETKTFPGHVPSPARPLGLARLSTTTFALIRGSVPIPQQGRVRPSCSGGSAGPVLPLR